MDEDKVQRPAPVAHRYAIDPEWFPGMMRDFTRLAQSRMCPSCRARLGTEVEERVPRPGAGGRVAFETQRTKYGDDPFAVIAECCCQRPDYRGPQLPVMEIVFRLFLANRNQPLALDDLTQQVVDWVQPGDGRVITPTVIERLILADDFYGIRQVEEALSAEFTATKS